MRPAPPRARPAPTLANRAPAVVVRAVVLSGLWVLLAGTDPLGLAFGLPAALLATLASIALLPPAPGWPAPFALARLLAGVAREGILAGWDIAWRALAREPRLAPGFVTLDLETPPGAARDALRLVASLAPGALPLEAGEGASITLHVLDTGVPHAAQLAETERRFLAAWSGRLG